MATYEINYNNTIIVKAHDLFLMLANEAKYKNAPYKALYDFYYNFVKFNKVLIAYRSEGVFKTPVGFLLHAQLTPSQANWFIKNPHEFPMNFHINKEEGLITQEWIVNLHIENEGSYEAAKVWKLLMQAYEDQVLPTGTKTVHALDEKNNYMHNMFDLTTLAEGEKIHQKFKALGTPSSDLIKVIR